MVNSQITISFFLVKLEDVFRWPVHQLLQASFNILLINYQDVFFEHVAGSTMVFSCWC